ncbi:MAG TPA: hypothetical protein PLY94_06595 [Gemmatimonadaceae bacterium]|nr:hypothetical protein [Gemmatimonadaceae bacterium]
MAGSHRVVAAVAIAAVLPGVASAQSRLNLPAPNWQPTAAFTAVAGVRELSNGDVLVIDSQEQQLYVLAADGRTRRSIARGGAGPGEFRAVRALMAMRGDSTALSDAALRRFVIFAPDGRAVQHIQLPEFVGEMALGATELMAGSALVYPARWSGDGARASEVPLLRWRLGASTVDTVGAIRREALPAAMRESGRAAPAGLIVPYLPNDVLVASAAGGFGILSAEPYRLTVYTADGRLVASGRPVPIERVRTSDRERGMMPPGWIPDTKPPFTEMGHFVDAAGRFWVRRSRAAGSTTTTYDVFSPAGEHLGEIPLTDNRRIVGAGARGVYLVRESDEGFQYLERYLLP